MKSDNVNKDIGARVREARIAKIYLTECKGNALKLQRLLGHSTLDMTKHYVRIYEGDLVNDFQKASPLEAIKKGRP